MAGSVVMPKDFNVDKMTLDDKVRSMSSGAKLVFGSYGGEPLLVQSPEMRVTFDAQNFSDDENNAKMSVKLSFGDLENDRNQSSFHTAMSSLDEFVKGKGIENSQPWFRKKTMSMDTIETVYTNMIRKSVDQETGEPDGKYPDSFTFKLKKRDGKYACRIFDENKKELNINNREEEDFVDVESCLKKGAMVKGLFKFDFVWLASGKFGVTWSALQLRIKVPKGLDDYAFNDDEEDEENGELAEKITFVESDSDEDE